MQLKAAGKLFRGVPARFADFKLITGTDVIPSSFCGICWIEDKRVAERLVDIWPNIVKYINEMEKSLRRTFQIQNTIIL